MELEEETHTDFSSQRVWKKGNHFWNQLIFQVRNWSENEHLRHHFKDATSFLANHPLLTLFGLAMAISCALPVLTFGVFAVFTILLSFTAFLLIEGTILALGLVALCGFIMMMLVIMLTMTASVAIAYYGFVQLYGDDKDDITKVREQ